VDEEVDGTGFVVVDVAQTSVEDAAAELEAAPGVAEVQPDVVRRAAAWTDDPVLEYAWPYVELMRLPRAWDATTGSGVVIAVLDTGVDPGVRDLAGALLPGIDLVNRDMNPADDHGHGTLMATTAAGRGNNGVASVGAAWTASVLPIKVLDASGSGADSVIAEGVAYAVDHGADVINLSLAGPGPSTVLRDAIASATARGVTVVAATGNAGREDPQYPAAYAPEIAGFLAVGATDDDGGLARFSSWGSGVSVVAPGWRIAGQVPGGATVVASGTSSATALVSGVAALLVSTGTTAPADVENRLLTSARDAGPRGVDPYFGRGVVDAAGALGLGHALPLDRAPGDPGASDDLPATARPLAAGAGTEATLSPEGDTDWYCVEVPAAGRYSVAVEQPGRPVTFDWPPDAPDLHVDVLDGNGRALVASGAGTSASLVGVVVDVTAAGPVLVGVSNLNGTATTQTYRVSVTAGELPALAGAATSVPDMWFGASTASRHSAGAPLRPTWALTAFRALDAASVTASTVQLVEGQTGAAVPVSRTYDAVSRRLSVVPSRDLLDGNHYTLVVAGVRDVDGSVQVRSERLWSTVGAAGDRFTPVEPLGVLDTRDGLGLAGTPRRLGPGQHVDLQLSPGATGVPVGATAVVLNVTAASSEGPGNIRVFPAPAAGSAVPVVSNLNLTRGVDQPNLVTVTLGPGGVVRLFVDGAWTDVVADLAGYYSPGVRRGTCRWSRCGSSTGVTAREPGRVVSMRGSGWTCRSPGATGCRTTPPPWC
jgi:subtilisin family serine protease